MNDAQYSIVSVNLISFNCFFKRPKDQASINFEKALFHIQGDDDDIYIHKQGSHWFFPMFCCIALLSYAFLQYKKMSHLRQTGRHKKTDTRVINAQTTRNYYHSLSQ